MNIGFRGPNTTNFGDINVRRVVENWLTGIGHNVVFSRRNPFSCAVDYVVDASGYAYYDRGLIPNIRPAIQCKKHHVDVPWVFLPQSWGPLNEKNRVLMRDLLREHVTVYSRDEHSQLMLLDVLGVRSSLVPDITFLDDTVQYLSPTDSRRSNHVVICPNTNVTDGRYIGWLHEVYENLSKNNVDVVTVVGDSGDVRYARQFDPIVISDVNEIKGILRHARLVFSSRYHILLYSMMFGTPVGCLGWSHKYDDLFFDAGITSYQVQLEDSPSCVLDMYDKSVAQNTKGYVDTCKRTILQESQIIANNLS